MQPVFTCTASRMRNARGMLSPLRSLSMMSARGSIASKERPSAGALSRSVPVWLQWKTRHPTFRMRFGLQAVGPLRFFATSDFAGESGR